MPKLIGDAIVRLWHGRTVFCLLFFLAACATTNSRYRAHAWELLGEREADFRLDKDRINVGWREGTFKEIRLAVRGGPVEIYDTVVTFADGNTFYPNLRMRLDENSSSREIELPGDRRVIRSVDFRYRSLDRREGRAVVMLYGR